MMRLLTLAALLLIALFWAMTAMAATGNPLAAPQSTDSTATVTVTSTGFITITTVDDEVNNDGNCSLREALRAAAMDKAVDACAAGSGSDIVVLPKGTYVLTAGQLEIAGTVTISGSTNGPSILDGNASGSVLSIDSNATVGLFRLDIRNGGHGCCYNRSLPTWGVENHGVTWIVYSSIHDNFAGSYPGSVGEVYGMDGGGIYNAGVLILVNSTVSANSPGGGDCITHGGYPTCGKSGTGAGIDNLGRLTLDFATVTDNQLVDINNRGSAIIKNSIINNCSGQVTALGDNVIQDITGCSISGDYIQWPAQLGPLQDNGGPTPTHDLAKNSPAVDTGDCIDINGITVTVDQRGSPRPQGNSCDIGAYESPYSNTFTIHDTSLPLVDFNPSPCTNTTTMCNLTHGGQDNGSPSWSPDGRKIAFSRGGGGPVGGIYLVNPDGSHQVKLADCCGSPVWSLDGSKIAFASSTSSLNSKISVIDIASGQQTNLTNSAVDARNPSWSPDGTRILYELFESCSSCAPNLYVMNADGSENRLLIPNAFIAGSPWSPDGAKILYTDSGISTNFHIANVNGTGHIDIATEGEEDSVPTWSPDGRKITYQCVRTHDGIQYDICEMNSDGTQRIHLTNDPLFDIGPAQWSPDGSKLLFQHTFALEPNVDQVNEITVMDAASGALTRLTYTPSDVALGGQVWSPDSRKVAFVSGVTGNPEIYVINISN